MHLVQLLLPVRHGDGTPVPREHFLRVRDELTETHGGATLYARAPASGTWTDERGAVERDDVVVVEVMVRRLDREWWKLYREELAARFGQDELLVRATAVDVL